MANNVSLFMKKLSEDENLQKKAAEALKALPADASEADQFNAVVAPLAKEMGLEVTLEDFAAMKDELSVSEEELKQTAGGGYGVGLGSCRYVGFGAGANVTSEGGMVCIVLGLGIGSTTCALQGSGL